MKIVLSGFFGAGNTGDEAILEAMIDHLRKNLNSPEITVFSLNPKQTAEKYHVRSIYRAWRRENIAKWKALREADLLISGGGGLLQDTYPTKIISGPLPYYLFIVFLAKLAKTKVMFFSQGIGPINSRYGKWLMRTFANMADLITVRDDYSKDLLKKLSVIKPDIYVTADIVFAYHKQMDNACFHSLPEKMKEQKERLIAVSVRPWFDRTDYYENLAASLDLIIERDDVYPIFVPMEGKHDVQASEEVIRRMQLADRCFILSPQYTPNQYLNFIANSRLVIGMRLHALIFATVENVPHIGISYDQKVENLLKRNGLWSFSFHLNDIDPERLAKNAHALFSQEITIKENLAKTAENLKIEALRNIDLLKTYFHARATPSGGKT